MNKSVLIFSFVFATFLASLHFYSEVEQTSAMQFQEWKQKYGARFTQSEHSYRKHIFEQNLLKVEKHNSDPTQTYKLGVNQFSIYDQNEFEILFLLPNKQNVQVANDSDYYKVQNLKLIDWTALGKVTPVKNQGSICSSCYAFATIAISESFNLIKSNITQIYSDQQLIDCSFSYGNGGCLVGSMQSSLLYINALGIAKSEDYPYTGVQQQCLFDGGLKKFKPETISGCTQISNQINNQPIGVMVDARNWQLYKSGVFNNCVTPTVLNRHVAIVGILTNNVWKIKNSWGTTWGESGYIRLSAGNTCGICNSNGIYPKLP